MKSAKSSVVHDHVTGHFNICNGDAALHLMPNKLSSNNSLYQKIFAGNHNCDWKVWHLVQPEVTLHIVYNIVNNE